MTGGICEADITDASTAVVPGLPEQVRKTFPVGRRSDARRPPLPEGPAAEEGGEAGRGAELKCRMTAPYQGEKGTKLAQKLGQL
jgi:hypothetical protein